jgi:hypothetical protein
VSTVLARCAERLRRLRPDWRDPARFFEERDALARTIELEAVARRQDTSPPSFYRVPEPVPDERARRLAALARRLAALARFQAGEVERLRRMLAEACRPRPRRRRARDDRQLLLTF